MLGKLTSFLSSSEPLPSSHTAPRRADTYVTLSKDLQKDKVPVSETDCASCSNPCADGEASGNGAGTIAEVIYDGKSYEEYVLEKYGELGELPKGFDMDWETELPDSSKGGKGRIVVISTGKSDWERDHVDEKGSLAHHLDKAISSAPSIKEQNTDNKAKNTLSYISPSAFPAPSQPLSHPISIPPSLYSSSLISQSDDPSDQTVLVFPDWKVVHEIDNSLQGAKELYDHQLSGELGRAGRKGVEEDDEYARRRSWVLPYRAVVLLCSHKRRDKRCHIAAPLLRSALHTVLSKHDIEIDEDGSSLTHLDGPPLEEIEGSDKEREEEVGKRIEGIEGVQGGEGGQVGIFNINHLGGHRYAGVMIILFPSGAYISYGRVTPQEIPRVVEDTILQGKIVPGLLRNAVGVQREVDGGKGFLTW
ncbi:hypothetical protein I302_104541 [Kwoniella bestiolae CBS 10118]|uniref:Uncharacterized protein n=1 Tax=Kwoniella bestiolae CBS 10118 TaxID=1296100 RepID=A0A1B9GBJ3_9TREE|nr:hypothetical protein I302_03246 [Kwoniella bestiolae CBS 10118]OCF28387.1 hypothetical protein I302_03246 [Kwoniella bestiolae CBS 10118]